MINKLTIVNGIIQDNNILGVPFKRDIVVPKGKSNVYTRIPMIPIGVAVHNTSNPAPTATDEAHARWLQSVEDADKQYVSVHFFVDDDSITQTIPINMVTYNAGDGNGPGNFKHVSVEICENGNILKAEENAKKLIASLQYTMSQLKVIRTHQSFSGKYCPHVLLSRKNGWTNFVSDIGKILNPPNPVINIINKVVSKPLVNTNATSVVIATNIWGYKTASDAMSGRNKIRIVPRGTYPIMIKHKTGAWNIGKGNLFWINPRDF